MNSTLLKSFLEYFNLYNSNPRKYNYTLENHSLDIQNRRLLESFKLFKKNKSKEPLAILKSFTGTNQELEAVRCYLIGLIYNQSCHYAFAKEHLDKSIALLLETKDQLFITKPLIVLALAYGNTRELDKMAITLDQLSGYVIEDPNTKVQYIQCQAAYYMLTDQTQKSITSIEQALSKFADIIVPHQTFFYTILFMAYFKQGNYNQCNETLSLYKELSGPSIKANYAYMKILLDHIRTDGPLYIYQDDFKLFPELLHQLQVIKHLANCEKPEAEKYWNLLMRHNPNLYNGSFSYQGDIGLFSTALNKHISKTASNTFNVSEINGLSTNLDKLNYIFNHAVVPISKFDLIQLIWKEDYTTQSEAKLQKLISRYKEKYQVAIDCQQGHYFKYQRAA